MTNLQTDIRLLKLQFKQKDVKLSSHTTPKGNLLDDRPISVMKRKISPVPMFVYGDILAVQTK